MKKRMKMIHMIQLHLLIVVKRRKRYLKVGIIVYKKINYWRELI